MGHELIVDTAENVIFTAVQNGSDVNARFLLLQKGRSRGYGRPEREDPPPPDPLAEQRRAEAVRMVRAIIEERARLGLPPLFGKPAPLTIADRALDEERGRLLDSDISLQSRPHTRV